MFTQLHTHCHYSLLEAIGKPEAMVAKAKELDMAAVCLTDYGGMYGAIEFYKAAKKEKIKPLLGVELGLVHDITTEDTARASQHYSDTIVLIAQNNDGYQALMELVSRANTEGFHWFPRIDFSLLKKFGSNLIALQSGIHSFVAGMIRTNAAQNKQEEILSIISDAVGEGCLYLWLCTRSEDENKGLKVVNDGLIALHESTDIPLIVSNNVHYIDPEDKVAFGVALSIKDGKRVFDEDKRKVTGDRHMLDQVATRTLMEQHWRSQDLIEHCFTSISTIIEGCTVALELGKILFPTYNTPDSVKSLYETVKEWLISD